MTHSFAEIARQFGLDPENPISPDHQQSWYTTLQEADQRLQDVIIYLHSGTAPPEIPDTESFLGAIPYLVEHGQDAGVQLPTWIKDFLWLLDEAKIVPKSQITTEQWGWLLDLVHANRAVDTDGTIYGFQKYEQLDPNWIATIIIRELSKTVAGFQNTPYTNINAPDSLAIGIVGDWGTGTETQYAGRNPAQKVINHLVDPGLDYRIHLGDVYYAGTSNSFDYGPYFREESAHFMDVWPPTQGKNLDFMLNSNHEMYSLGHGYIDVGLAAPRFSHQNDTSYFLIENNYWQIFGLDSAFNSPDQTTFMTGGLTQSQITWMQTQRRRAPQKRVMLMSHHNPITTDGSAIVGADQGSDNLWAQALRGLNGQQPDYWYWGHVHNAIVYSGLGNQLPQPFTTHGRCIGHGAIPYGFAWGLAEPNSMSDFTSGGIPLSFTPKNTVQYFAHQPVSDTDPYVKNGYAIIKLDGPQIFEKIYDEDGTLCWTAQWLGDNQTTEKTGFLKSMKKLFSLRNA